MFQEKKLGSICPDNDSYNLYILHHIYCSEASEPEKWW